MDTFIITHGDIKAEVTLEQRETESHFKTVIYNITEDLLNDYRYFKLRARRFSEHGDVFSTQRY